MPKTPAPQRRYDKGWDRRKHVGRRDWPEIVFDGDNPKKWIGKCPRPAAMPDALRKRLLDEAIAGEVGDRDVDYIKTLYVVHQGVIYAAQTSDAGTSYHGYPYKGKMSGELLERLRRMAKDRDCEKEFDKWVDRHIVRHGERR